MDEREEWVNVRMQKIVARPFCPNCHLFLEEHDDEVCNMRYTIEPEEALCLKK